MKNNKEVRCFDLEMRTLDNEESKMIIEGYPVFLIAQLLMDIQKL